METKNLYDKIADSWYNIRHWTLFRKELSKLNERWEGGRLLNVGCAHGADFLPFDEDRFEFYGTDVSSELLKNGRKYAEKFDLNFNLFQSDMKKLPIKQNKFNYVICVASLHHLLEKEQRLKALKEMRRVLKPGGGGFITVWNKWQPGFLFGNKIIKKDWEYKGEELTRKYYLYTYRELRKDLNKSGFKVLDLCPESDYKIPIKYFSKNILALIEK